MSQAKKIRKINAVLLTAFFLMSGCATTEGTSLTSGEINSIEEVGEATLSGQETSDEEDENIEYKPEVEASTENKEYSYNADDGYYYPTVTPQPKDMELQDNIKETFAYRWFNGIGMEQAGTYRYTFTDETGERTQYSKVLLRGKRLWGKEYRVYPANEQTLKQESELGGKSRTINGVTQMYIYTVDEETCYQVFPYGKCYLESTLDMLNSSIEEFDNNFSDWGTRLRGYNYVGKNETDTMEVFVLSDDSMYNNETPYRAVFYKMQNGIRVEYQDKAGNLQHSTAYTFEANADENLFSIEGYTFNADVF